MIEAELAERMKRMIGFRYIAVHEYQKLDQAILVAIIEHHLVDFEQFSLALLRAG